MWLSLKFLKVAIQVQGWIIFAIALFWIILTLVLTIEGNKAFDDQYQTAFNVVMVIFWIYCILLLAISYCGIQGARKNNRTLIILFNIGNILMFIGNISTLTSLEGEIGIFAGFIIFTIILGVMIIFTCCFTYHPELERDNYQMVTG